MMKKIFVGIAAIGLLTSGTAFAAGSAQQNAGCGLGAQVIGEKANESLIGQLAMTFLNGISGTQTFGISSGTSECKTPSKIVLNDRLQEFVAANLDTLAKEIASARGESLDTLAELMEIPAAERTAVYGALQANFARIFPSNQVEAADVIDQIVSVIQG